MRSSKSRSRSKSNRNRSVGNVVNRVFDSSGPEGKVRGTPQQIIDKYNQLTRDAQLSNDRVAAENFQQHAEHYLRMLAEAMKEQQERQAQQQQQQQERQQRNNQNNGNSNDQQGNRGGDAPSEAQKVDPSQQPQPESQPAPQSRPEPKAQGIDDVIEVRDDSESPLVETPENKPPRPRRSRRKPEPKAEAQPEASETPASTPDAAE